MSASLKKADPRVFANLAYSNQYYNVVATAATSIAAKYGQLIASIGAPSEVTVTLPHNSQLTAANGMKDTFHVSVINCDGLQTVLVATPDGKTINGAASPLTIGSGDGVGAFADLFWSTQLDAWVAKVGCCAGGGG